MTEGGGSISLLSDFMRRIYWTIATFLGLGFSPWAPGTAGTVGAVVLYYLLSRLSMLPYLLVTLVVTLMGAWAADWVGKELGKEDSPQIVIDEVAGFLIAMVGVSFDWKLVIIGFLFFRLFDIWKPFPIRWSEKGFPGGWGVMIDDLIAGLYARLVLWGFEVWFL